MSVPSTVQVLPHGLLHGGGRMGDLLRLYDWTTTPLGSVDTWPSCLTQAASIVLHLGLSSILLWGPKCVSIYNDHYIGILDKKHPAALGKSCNVTSFPAIAHRFRFTRFGYLARGR